MSLLTSNKIYSLFSQHINDHVLVNDKMLCKFTTTHQNVITDPHESVFSEWEKETNSPSEFMFADVEISPMSKSGKLYVFKHHDLNETYSGVLYVGTDDDPERTMYSISSLELANVNE